ncbi:GtrA family protein [Undibacterium sp. JH2W]|uniref:GtrA family protein n=1 Tax=Undibacterium sp. JH2W TaxID=3413037 RepID=UPI003BF02821
MYSIFALIAMIVNITTQDIVIRHYNGAFAILASLIIGTGAGLVVKYVLDKRYIFRFHAQNATHDGKTFVLYTLMGVITTVVFWGFEFGFDFFFKTKEMRYAGGALGLAIGYLCKYKLDKRYVFRTDPA